jgi:hypothetical protein
MKGQLTAIMLLACVWLSAQPAVIHGAYLQSRFYSGHAYYDIPNTTNVGYAFTVEDIKSHVMALALVGWDADLQSLVSEFRFEGVIPLKKKDFTWRLGLHLTPAQLNYILRPPRGYETTFLAFGGGLSYMRREGTVELRYVYDYWAPDLSKTLTDNLRGKRNPYTNVNLTIRLNLFSNCKCSLL